MESVCPVCKNEESIPEDRLEHPITKTTCQGCGTILLVNPDSGKVDAHKSPLRDSPEFEIFSTQPSDKASSVLSMRSKEKSVRDWPAIVVVVIFLIVLIAAGVYFAVNLGIV
jgi:ribosomal protein S27E